MMIHLTALALLAAIVPAIFGAVLARYLSGPRIHLLQRLGQGYILGALALVWLINAWDAIGWPFTYWPMLSVLLFLTVAVFAASRRAGYSEHPGLPGVIQHTGIRWQHTVILILCAAMAAHLLFVAEELFLRPTFPWDAWRGWEPKTIQFFGNRSLQAQVTTIGNHGEVSTHALLWMMLATDSTHEPVLHVPWLLAYAALAATVYGYLRARSTTLVATTGAYLVMSLPYLNTHVALAGYADIWLALAFTVGVMAVADCGRNRDYRQLVVALLMVVACLQAKRAGVGFAALLLALLIIKAGPIRVSKSLRVIYGVAIALIAGVVGAALLGYIDLAIPIAPGRQILLSSENFSITGVLLFTFDPQWQPRPFFEALLKFGNWHLLAYLWIGLVAVLLIRRKWQLLLRTENLGIIGGMAVIGVYFVLVSPETALDHTGLSRALLYIMPLTVAWLMVVTQQLSEKQTPLRPDSAE